MCRARRLPALGAIGVVLALAPAARTQDNPYGGKGSPYQQAPTPDVIGRIKNVAQYSPDGALADKLNARLRELQHWKGDLPDTTLRADLLQHLSVCRVEGSEVAVLRRAGTLPWPEAWKASAFDTVRKRTKTLLGEAVRQAKQGKVGPETLRELTESIDHTQEALIEQVNQISTAQYLDAKRFQRRLRGAAKALEDPRLRADLAASDELPSRGKTIASLVRYMRANRLSFAPAAPGDEAAYAELERILADRREDDIPAELRK
jgi:hypothetical protein